MQASIAKVNGQMCLSIGNTQAAPVAFRSFRPQANITADFSQHGFRLFNLFPSGINCALANRTIPYSPFGEVWAGEGIYRWDRLREQVDLLEENAPGSLVSVNVQLDAPDWYLRAHSECADSWDQLIQNAGYQPWRESAARYLCDLIDTLDAWLPGRLYGIFLLAGGTTEWYTRNMEGFTRPLPIQTDAFRAWSGNPDARIPPPDMLHRTTDGCFRHPVKDADALSYWRFVSEIVTDCIRYFAAIAKRHTHGTKLVGAFTGYIHGMALPGVVRSSYNEFSTILRDPNIDCIFCPASYRFRKLADTSAFRVPVDSYALYNKLYFHEIDSTTHLTHDHPVARLHSKHDGPFADLRDTAAYFRREVGMTLAKGQGYWWFDMFAGWYDEPQTMNELERLRLLSETMLRLPTRPISEVCLVTDLESNYYLGTDPDTPYPMAEEQAPDLNRMGCPWDSILTDDLFSEAFDEKCIKLFIFPNLFKPTERLLAKIQALRQAGKSLLFTHAPGYIAADGFSLDGMRHLTGLTLARADDSGDEIIGDDGIRRPMTVTPRFWAVDSDETWARYSDGRAALALRGRQESAGFDAFCAAAPVPAAWLRHLAERAGCFRYIDTADPLYANSRLLTVFCHEPGTRRFFWPQPAQLMDFFSGDVFQTGPEGAAVPFGANETRIFLVEPGPAAATGRILASW